MCASSTAATSYPSAGATPYGFDFANGTLVVTEAFGGQPSAGAASSYRLEDGALATVSSSVRDERSEVCSAVASVDGRIVWVTPGVRGLRSSPACERSTRSGRDVGVRVGVTPDPPAALW